MRGSTKGAIHALIVASLMAEAGGCAVRVWEIRPEPAAGILRNLAGEAPLGQPGDVRHPAIGPSPPSPPNSGLASAERLFDDARRAEVLSRDRAPGLYGECMALAMQEMSGGTGRPTAEVVPGSWRCAPCTTGARAVPSPGRTAPPSPRRVLA